MEKPPPLILRLSKLFFVCVSSLRPALSKRQLGERVGRPNYRGCPQLNVAAEFPDLDHPARAVATAHKKELRRRLRDLAERLRAKRPDELAAQLSLLINGVFVSSQMFSAEEATPILLATSRALIASARAR